MLKRPHYIGLGLIVVLTLVILNLPSKTTARIKLGIGSFFVPLFGLVNSAQQGVNRAGDALLPRSELMRQNELLHEQNEELKLQLSRTEAVARENDRLRELLKWPQKQKRGKYKLAAVVVRDPANWWRTVQIDLGSRDGVRENQPVLTTEGLVGRVLSVSFANAQVVLVGDPKCNVSARVENETRDAGIVGTSGPLDTSLVEMNYLPRSANVKAGQNVVTSGEGGIFPKGIPIGKIVDSRPAEFGLYTEARVKLNANLAGLEELWVIIQ